MTNPKRRILLIVITALTGAFLLLPGVVGGQEEPTPEDLQNIAGPVFFAGSVMLNGAPAPDGTPIEAIRGLVEDLVCGETTTKNGEYLLRVLSGFGVGEDYGAECHGTEVVFRSGELIAPEIGRTTGADVEALDLTFGNAPEFPDTGTGASSSSGTRVPPWLLLALSATGIAAIGAAVIARGRAVRP